jgi:hypothetical protein
MARNKNKALKRDPLPENFNSLEDFWTFWDTHSTADYEDLMEEVDVQMNFGSRKIYCAVAKDLLVPLRTQARQQGVSAQTLINLWLREKVMEVSKKRVKVAL